MNDYSGLLEALLREQERVKIDGRHVYRFEGKARPGVTSVIRCLDAPALDNWKVKVQVEGTARAAHANPPTFGETLESYTTRLVEIAKEQYEHQRIADEAADIGKQVHKLTEHAIRTMLGQPTEPPIVTEEAHFVFAGWEGWAKGEGFKPLAAEARVYHREADYCGTVDCLALLRGKLGVVDWKPTSTLYAERRLQLAAYVAALGSMGWPANDMERYIVALPRDGGAVSMCPVDSDYNQDIAAFYSCLGLYRWQKALAKAKEKAA